MGETLNGQISEEERLNEMANEFSEEMLSFFPKSSDNLIQEEIDRIRDVVRGYSYIGFKNGYKKALDSFTPKQSI